MNYTPLFAAFALVACSKDARQVKYSAVCDSCFVSYQSDDRTESSVAVHGRWIVFPVDTVYTLADTTYVLDSTYALGTWSIAVDLRDDARPYVKARNGWGSAITTIEMVNNGASSKAEARSSMQELELH